MMKILFLIALLVVVASSKHLPRNGKKANAPLNIWSSSGGKSRPRYGKTLGFYTQHEREENREDPKGDWRVSNASRRLTRLLKCIHSGIEEPPFSSSVLSNAPDCPCPIGSTHKKPQVLSDPPRDRGVSQEISENPCSEFESDGEENLEKLRAIIDEILVTLDTVERQKATVEELREKIGASEN